MHPWPHGQPPLEQRMILVRNTFRIKFGQSKPAVAAFKSGREMMLAIGLPSKSRVLTDLVAPMYTLVHEIEFESLTAFEQTFKMLTGKPEWRAWYEKFIPYCETGSREIMNIVE
jgi:hypothetical protein